MFVLIRSTGGNPWPYVAWFLNWPTCQAVPNAHTDAAEDASYNQKGSEEGRALQSKAIAPVRGACTTSDGETDGVQLQYTLQQALARFAQNHHRSFSDMEEGTSDRGSASVQRPQWHEALQRLGSEAAHEPQQQGIGWVAAMLLLVSLVLAATMQQRQILRYTSLL